MRLIDNVWVNGVCYPKGCCPPAPIADLIGDHAWEAGDPTVDCPPDVDVQVPDATDAATPAASVVDPATLDGSLMGPIDDEPDDSDEHDKDDGEPDDDGDGGEQDDESSPAADPQPIVLPDPLPPEPPRAGRGASRTSWADYAAVLRLNTTDDMNRDDIIAAVDAHLAQFRA